MSTGPGTPSLLRSLNDRRVLALLLEQGPSTRTDLARLSGLSKQTATQVVQRLQSAGVIELSGHQSAGRGPTAAVYAPVARTRVGVALDARESELTAVLVDVLGRELARVELRAEAVTPHELLAATSRACAQADVPVADLDLAVVALSASVDPVTDTLRFSEDFPGWPATDVRRRLALALGCDVVLDNDVKLAARIERTRGAGAGSPGFLLLWMGTGVGLATDIGGTVIQGVSGAAGEIGYLAVPPRSDRRDPGRSDGPATLQDVLSATALARLAVPALAEDAPEAEVREALARVMADDALLGEAARRIADGLLASLAILDPGLVVLAGLPAWAGGSRLAARVSHWLAVSSPWHARVEVSGVSENPVTAGAQDVLVSGLRRRLLDSVGPEG